jgi:small subunit ribosomal protein S15
VYRYSRVMDPKHLSTLEPDLGVAFVSFYHFHLYYDPADCCILILSSFTYLQVAQLVKENQRFQPSRSVLEVGSSVDDDDDEDIDAPPPDDYIVNVGDLEGDDQEAGIEDDGQPPAWAVSQQRLTELRVQYRRHEKDTGSPEYQVAGMTERITYLTKHLQLHPKDYSTRRGLVALVNKRRRLLNYLFSENIERYKEVVLSLGVRHKAPGAVVSREDKYGRFPQQQAIKKHLVTKKRGSKKK